MFSYDSAICGCGGTIKFNPYKQQYMCDHCRQVYDRSEKYEGLASVKVLAAGAVKQLARRELSEVRTSLAECERADKKYIGTIIANLAYQMICALECSEREEIERAMRLVQNFRTQFSGDFPSIVEEEKLFYQEVDDSDSLAMLSRVYNLLHFDDRCAYLLTLIEPAKIVQTLSATALVDCYLSLGDTQGLLELVGRCACVNKADALQKVLGKLPDGEEKTRLAEKLSEGRLDEKQLEEYLVSSDDSSTTKLALVNGADGGARLSVKGATAIIQNAPSNEAAVQAIDLLLKSRLTDSEMNELLDFVASLPAPMCLQMLSRIKESGQFVLIKLGIMQSVLKRGDLQPAEALQIIELLLEFAAEKHLVENAAEGYLLDSDVPPAFRNEILPFLLSHASTINPNVVNTYLCEFSEGRNKVEMMRCLLSSSKVLGLYSALPTAYVTSTADSAETKNSVLEVLYQFGLRIEPSPFTAYILDGAVKVEEKLAVLRLLPEDKRAFLPTAASNYLESADNVLHFHPELFSYLFTDGSPISDAAMCNFLLCVKEEPQQKMAHTAALTAGCTTEFGAQSCIVNALGGSLSCCLAHAYMLLSPDDLQTTLSILSMMPSLHRLLGNSVRLNGQSDKFKKIVIKNSNGLGAVARQVCAANKLI